MWFTTITSGQFLGFCLWRHYVFHMLGSCLQGNQFFLYWIFFVHLPYWLASLLSSFKNYFWLHWVFIGGCGLFFFLSLWCGEWGLLFIEVCGLLIAVASLVAELRLQSTAGFGSRGTCELSRPTVCGNLSSQVRDGTQVPCKSRRILNHGTTREVPLNCLFVYI